MKSVPFRHRGVALGGAADKFDDALELTDEGTRDFVTSFLAEFGRWLGERG